MRKSNRPKGASPHEGALINNQGQKELQDTRIMQVDAGIRTEAADITAAEAGIEAAKSVRTFPSDIACLLVGWFVDHWSWH